MNVFSLCERRTRNQQLESKVKELSIAYAELSLKYAQVNCEKLGLEQLVEHLRLKLAEARNAR